MAFIAIAPARAQQSRTLKSEMEVIHESLGVNFVYDSAIEIDVPYSGKPMKDVINANKKEHSVLLEECLQTLFAGTNIEYEIMKKYIVLTRADKRKKPKDYTIFIEEQHDTIDEAVITALTDPKRNQTQTGLKRIDSSDINSGFALFSTPDVIKTLQMMPGVASGTELLSGFYVHGGDGSDNLFLIDGVPVYQVSHLLGLFSSFNSDVIGNMDFYKSGFPARYGSKMSSVVDITTRDGDFEEYHGLFGIGLIDGRLQYEGPLVKGKTSFNVGLRRTWTETLTVPFFAILNNINSPDKHFGRYALTDLNAKVTHKFAEGNRLSANFYTGRDKFKIHTEYPRSYYENTPAKDIMDGSLLWGNVLGSLNWDYEPCEDISTRTIAYYSGSISDLGVFVQEIDEHANSRNTGEYSTSNVHHIGLKHDVYHKASKMHLLRYGASLQYQKHAPSATAKSDIKEDGMVYNNIDYKESLRYHTFEASIYAEDEISFTDAFSVNAGLRYDLYSSAGSTWHSLEPRIALRYAFNDKFSAKASYTEMSQPVHLVSSIYLDLPTNSWLPSTSKVRPSRSREAAAGIYMNLAHNMHLNVEGYYKHMYNLLEYAGIYNVFPPLEDWESSYKMGNGRSWGGEIDFGYDNGRTEANLYYTLSWTQRKFDDFHRGWYPDRNDNRHKLTLMAKHKFGKRLEAYCAWNWHSGNRITIASHYTEGNGGGSVYAHPNNVKLPDYHRLDVGLNFVKTTKRGNTAIWNMSIYNAYCRTNPISAFEDMRVLDDRVFAYYGLAVGLIPIVPTFSYTLKF